MRAVNLDRLGQMPGANARSPTVGSGMDAAALRANASERNCSERAVYLAVTVFSCRKQLVKTNRTLW